MDFGLGAFLEKFEAHFGARATRWLLILVSLALVVTCSSLIWNLALKPIGGLASSLIAFTPTWATAVKVFWLAASIGAGFGTGAILVATVRSSRMKRKAAQVLDAAEKQAVEVDLQLDKMEALVAQNQVLTNLVREKLDLASEYRALSSMLADDLLRVGKAKSLLEPDQVAALEFLKGIEPEDQRKLDRPG